MTPTKRYSPFVCFNHAVDVNRAKNSCCALIIIDDNAITPRRDVGMIRRWH